MNLCLLSMFLPYVIFSSWTGVKSHICHFSCLVTLWVLEAYNLLYFLCVLRSLGSWSILFCSRLRLLTSLVFLLVIRYTRAWDCCLCQCVFRHFKLFKMIFNLTSRPNTCGCKLVTILAKVAKERKNIWQLEHLGEELSRKRGNTIYICICMCIMSNENIGVFSWESSALV